MLADNLELILGAAGAGAIGLAAYAGRSLLKKTAKAVTNSTMSFMGFSMNLVNDPPVFSVRGTLVARHSSGGATAIALGNTPPASAADVSALSGNSIQYAANSNQKCVSWNGRGNTPNGRAISVLIRYRPSYTGSPSATQNLFALATGGGRQAVLQLIHDNTTGNILCLARNELGTIVMNSVSLGAFSPTSGTWYDLVFTWDGTNGANSAAMYVDASSIGTVTPTGSLTASWTNQYYSEIALGSNISAGTLNGARFDEICIWDWVIDPTSVALESGTGSLNGASRTSLVDSTAFDGTSYSDPGVANVKSGVSYTYAGVSQTGTLVSSSGTSTPQCTGPGAMWRN